MSNVIQLYDKTQPPQEAIEAYQISIGTVLVCTVGPLPVSIQQKFGVNLKQIRDTIVKALGEME